MPDARSPRALLKRERVRVYLLAVAEDRRPGDAIPSERPLSAEPGRLPPHPARRIVSRLSLGPAAADDRPAPDASRSASWWGTVE